MNYAERDIMALDEEGGHYARHINAMTAEQLHSKCDIAAELGWRDAQIERLQALRQLDEQAHRALLARCGEMEAICASMLQRWAVIFNLEQGQPEGIERDAAIAGVATLSAEEFIADGARAGAARLLRQEQAARVLLEVEGHLQRFPIQKDSRLHDRIRVAAQQLSSYPQLSPVTVRKSVDVPPEGLEPGQIMTAG